MLEQFEAFFESPTRQNYVDARDALSRADLLPTDDACLAHLTSLCAEGEYELASELLEIMLPAWTLSPRFHYWSAVVSAELGDEANVELEQFLFQACLDGLLNTGDGSASSPYVVTYRSDISDLLLVADRQAHLRSLSGDESRWIEKVLCSDRAHVHFDVSDLLQREQSETASAAFGSDTSYLVRSE